MNECPSYPVPTIGTHSTPTLRYTDIAGCSSVPHGLRLTGWVTIVLSTLREQLYPIARYFGFQFSAMVSRRTLVSRRGVISLASIRTLMEGTGRIHVLRGGA